jgi:heat shock protein HtpX
MWDIIRANRRKSAVLVVLLACCLALVGYAVGCAMDPNLGLLGAAGALAVWFLMMASALAGGERVLLAQAGAREARKQDAPQLVNIVEEMTIAAGLPVPPRVYIVDDPTPNAFAVGLSPSRAAVAVNTGLLARLTRDELQGVVAHEIGHIANRDTLFMTLAGVTVGAVVILSDFYLRGLRYGGFRGRSRDDRGSGHAAALMAVIAVVLAVLAPLLTRLLYFACSRRREYLADASAAQFTRYPEGLASALEKISGAGPANAGDVSRVLAPMYIVPPLAAAGAWSGLFGTHPPVEDRIRILRGMRSDASLVAYERSFQQAHGGSSVVASSALRGLGPVAVRGPATAAPADSAGQWRQAKNILYGPGGLRSLDCPCGLRIKLPPDFDVPTPTCPRCGSVHRLPEVLLS